MPPQPPPLPSKKNLQLATALNAFLPGAGLFYLGQRVVGLVLAVAFLFCFVALVGVFLVSYAHYLALATDGNPLEGNKLEEAGAAFHGNWLVGLAVAGVGLYAWSG